MVCQKAFLTSTLLLVLSCTPSHSTSNVTTEVVPTQDSPSEDSGSATVTKWMLGLGGTSLAITAIIVIGLVWNRVRLRGRAQLGPRRSDGKPCDTDNGSARYTTISWLRDKKDALKQIAPTTQGYVSHLRGVYERLFFKEEGVASSRSASTVKPTASTTVTLASDSDVAQEASGRFETSSLFGRTSRMSSLDISADMAQAARTRAGSKPDTFDVISLSKSLAADSDIESHYSLYAVSSMNRGEDVITASSMQRTPAIPDQEEVGGSPPDTHLAYNRLKYNEEQDNRELYGQTLSTNILTAFSRSPSKRSLHCSKSVGDIGSCLSGSSPTPAQAFIPRSASAFSCLSNDDAFHTVPSVATQEDTYSCYSGLSGQRTVKVAHEEQVYDQTRCAGDSNDGQLYDQMMPASGVAARQVISPSASSASIKPARSRFQPVELSSGPAVMDEETEQGYTYTKYSDIDGNPDEDGNLYHTARGDISPAVGCHESASLHLLGSTDGNVKTILVRANSSSTECQDLDHSYSQYGDVNDEVDPEDNLYHTARGNTSFPAGRKKDASIYRLSAGEDNAKRGLVKITSTLNTSDDQESMYTEYSDIDQGPDDKDFPYHTARGPVAPCKKSASFHRLGPPEGGAKQLLGRTRSFQLGRSVPLSPPESSAKQLLGRTGSVQLERNLLNGSSLLSPDDEDQPEYADAEVRFSTYSQYTKLYGQHSESQGDTEEEAELYHEARVLDQYPSVKQKSSAQPAPCLSSSQGERRLSYLDCLLEQLNSTSASPVEQSGLSTGGGVDDGTKVRLSTSGLDVLAPTTSLAPSSLHLSNAFDVRIEPAPDSLDDGTLDSEEYVPFAGPSSVTPALTTTMADRD